MLLLATRGGALLEQIDISAIGVIPDAVWDTIVDLIDDDCDAQDKELREAAGQL
jgi:hypothetical protein